MMSMQAVEFIHGFRGYHCPKSVKRCKAMQERIGNYCVEYVMGMPCAQVYLLRKDAKGYRKIVTVYMGSWNECVEWAIAHTEKGDLSE